MVSPVGTACSVDALRLNGQDISPSAVGREKSIIAGSKPLIARELAQHTWEAPCRHTAVDDGTTKTTSAPVLACLSLPTR